MKKKKAKKARKAVKAVKRPNDPLQRFVSTVFDVTQAAQSYGIRFPDTDSIDTNETSAFEFAYNNVAAQVKAIWGQVEGAEFNSGDVALLVLMNLWKRGKVVYEFDPEFFEVLSNSAASQVHVDVLKRLPHNNFFLYVPCERIIGYAVSISFSGNDQVWISCARFDASSENSSDVCSCGCQMHWYVDGEDMIPESATYTPLWEHQNELTTPYDPVALQNKILREVIMGCYYLAASNAELVEHKGGSKYLRKNGMPVSITDIQAGPQNIRYGKPFGGTSSKPNANDEEKPAKSELKHGKPSAKPSPHIRRAHWHHYWTGPGKEKLEVRWIAPVFVGGHESRDTVVRTLNTKS